jgi:hypothetical protein
MRCLGLKLVDDAATRLVAQKIIELVQRGVKDVETLNAMILEQFEHQQTQGELSFIANLTRTRTATSSNLCRNLF